MRFYSVADIHAKQRRLSTIRDVIRRHKPDALIVAGDLTNFRKTAYMVRILDNLGLPVLAVRGNTDRRHIEQCLDRFENTSSLHLVKKEIAGVSFAGFGGTIPIPRMVPLTSNFVRGTCLPRPTFPF